MFAGCFDHSPAHQVYCSLYLRNSLRHFPTLGLRTLTRTSIRLTVMSSTSTITAHTLGFGSTSNFRLPLSRSAKMGTGAISLLIGSKTVHRLQNTNAMPWPFVPDSTLLRISPTINGVDRVSKVFHSSEFKNRSQFGVGKTVLILGSGETAMDLGYLAMHSPIKRGLMSHRDGFLCAPKRVPDPVILPILGNKPDPNRLNVPVDSGSASLFDTA